MSIDIPMRKPSGTYYVYVFKCGEYYKIGITGHLRKRLCAINTASPLIVECVRFYKMDKRRANDLEGHLHRLFDDKRMRNEITGMPKEWFTLESDDLLTIDMHCLAEARGIKAINVKLENAFKYAEFLKSSYMAIPRETSI